LADGGRAGVIVPEGIIFQSQNAYKKLRKMLVDDYLWCVVSLPAGVFKPYSGVKTSILLMDKMLAKKTNKILFVKIENDGFDLGDQRRPIDKNDLPKAGDFIKNYKLAVMNGTDVEDTDFAHAVEKTKIAESGDWNLTGGMYQENGTLQLSDFEMVELSKIITVTTGRLNANQAVKNGKYPFYTCGREILRIDNTAFKGECILLAGNGDFNVKYHKEGPFNAYQRTYVIKSNNEDRLSNKFLLYIIQKAIQLLLSQGGVIQFLRLPQIKGIKIPLPPLDVQKAIVAEIDGYQKIIDGARQVVDNYKPTIKIDPDWPISPLGQLAKNLDGKRIPISKSDRRKGKYPYYGASGIVDYVDDYIFDDDLLLISEDGANLLARVTPIAFSVSGKCWVNNHAHVLKFDNKETQIFVEIYLNSISLEHYVTGAAQPKLNQAKLNSIPIPLPSSTIQKGIVGQIESEQQIVNDNKKLIEMFEHKIKDKIAEVWGFGTSQVTVESKADEMADEQVRATTPYKNDASVVCFLLAEMEKRQRPTTEFFIQKHIFVAKHHLHLPVNSVFKRKVAGPWSQELRWKAIEAAIKMNWLRCEKKRFVAGSAFEKALNHAATVLGEGTAQIAQLVEDLKTFGQKGLERWTTVLKVVQDLKEMQQPITRANIQHEIDNWRDKRLKEIFAEESVDYTIKMMLKHKWLPKAAGQ